MRANSRLAAILLAVVAAGWFLFGSEQGQGLDTGSGNPGVIAVSELPRTGKATYEKIHLGGPFPYEKDGSVFGNYERLLPGQPRGYYREYTVATDGAPNRGARRIVCGGPVVTAPEVCYYTSDHYSSFRKIVEQ